MKFAKFLLKLVPLGACGAVMVAAGIYLHLAPTLPSVEVLKDVKLQTPMRVYSREGDLIGQFGEKKRNPLPYDQIPPLFTKALLAAEDDGFFNHVGIDFMGLARAVTELVLTGEKGSGGSTLTMQVARNYFLTLERTFTRKFKEILLSLEIERVLTKEEILELYFNQMFLGHRAYGFEAAAQVYYGKNIDELDLPQLAMLAGLPKAPSRYNPISNPERSLVRRNWILGRMESLDYITRAQYEAALEAPVTASHHGAKLAFDAPYAAEMARAEMIDKYGLAAYSDGYHVFTTISSDLQKTANAAVESGLTTYDERHGYRGPELSLPPPGAAENAAAEDAAAPAAAGTDTESAADGGEERDEIRELWLDQLEKTAEIGDRIPAIVTQVGEDNSISVLLPDGSDAPLPWENGPSEARPYINENSRGPAPQNAAALFSVGDLIRVRRQGETLHLTQVPEAQAAFVALNPDDGALLSIVGGLGFAKSKFNRATQAVRQPGSSFKPFIYSAALEQGWTAASIINDAPVVFRDAALEDTWRPENDGGKFYGPTRLRLALTKSRNLVSIRLLEQIGISTAIDYAGRFGFNTREMPRDLSLALGTHAVTPLELATAYASLANGGYRVFPYLVDHVENFDREEVFRTRPVTVCRDCDEETPVPVDEELSMEEILDTSAADVELPQAERVMDECVNFIITSMMQDVIRFGTGRRARVLEREDIAGKTGTTNGPTDAWFSGFNADVVATAWLGFDQNLELGKSEFGGKASLPMWIDFMRVALANSPDRALPVPECIVNVKIDPETGLLARPGQPDAIFEYFRVENVPTDSVSLR